MDRPSIERAAACGYISLPFTTASTGQPYSLCRGFDSQIAANSKTFNPFDVQDSPFDPVKLRGMEIMYHPQDECRGTYTSASSSQSTSSLDHMSLSLGIGIGNKYLGASVTGSFDKSVLDNKALSKSSRRANCCAGTLHFSITPALTAEAIALLKGPIMPPNANNNNNNNNNHPKPYSGIEEFHKKYGDFYISALTIGADAGIMVSQSSTAHSSVDRVKVEAEAHALIWSDTETLMSEDISESSKSWQFGVTAFDSLNDSFVDIALTDDNGLGFQDAHRVVRDYSERVERLNERVEEKLDLWPQLAQRRHGRFHGHLGEGSSESRRVYWTDVEGIARSGLISRITLSPFVTHRDVRPYLE